MKSGYERWQQLLCSQRLSSLLKEGATVLEASKKDEPTRSPFNQDYGRVLYSSAFRCLQDKTQVFPLGRNDYVRTRLTHSLEVANVGRALAYQLADIIAERYEGTPHLATELGEIVATACLAHDIGNPPFGHSGEKAIGAALNGSKFKDFEFEGNAQGFRLLARICDPIKDCGLNLSAATLAAFSKYPCTRVGQKEATEKYIGNKKFGIYPEELPRFEAVVAACGLRHLGAQSWARHPLSYLMEAADDISYLVADVEDAYVSHLISYEQAQEKLFLLLDADKQNFVIKTHKDEGAMAALRLLRALCIGACILAMQEVMCKNLDALCEGELPVGLVALSSIAAAHQELSSFSRQEIYNSQSVVRVEVTGYQVIRKLMELFMEWVNADKVEKGSLAHKLEMLLHAPQGLSKQERFLRMIDHVSGMTDSYALQCYQELFGMK